MFRTMLRLLCVLGALCVWLSVEGAPLAAYAAPPLPTPRPRVLPRARSAPPIGGRIPIGQAPGFATAANRPVRTPVLAYDAPHNRLAVAWLAWGADLANIYAGDVWVRVQGQGSAWEDAEAINLAPVRAYFGGLGLAWAADGTLVAAYGDGNGAIWLRERRQGRWSAPERLGSGQLSALQTDPAGTLHALIISGRAVVQGQPRYGVRGADGRWVWSDLPTGTSYNGQLALLPLPDAADTAPSQPRLRRFVLISDATGQGHPLTLFRSDDGVRWSATPMPLGCCLPRPEHPAATSLLAAFGPDGTGVVAVAWSQPAGPGRVAGGVFAAVSIDGGLSFGPEEVIAQHRADGSFADGQGGTIGGFEPSLAYDWEIEQLAVSWVEDDLNQPGRSASSSNRIVRTRLAGRALTPDTEGWTDAITPAAQDPLGPPVLTGWGVRGHLWGDAAGERHWLLTIDERNGQARIGVQPLDLPGLLVAVPS